MLTNVEHALLDLPSFNWNNHTFFLPDQLINMLLSDLVEIQVRRVVNARERTVRYSSRQASLVKTCTNAGGWAVKMRGGRRMRRCDASRPYVSMLGQHVVQDHVQAPEMGLCYGYLTIEDLPKGCLSFTDRIPSLEEIDT
jgi:hypothetical protein